MAEKVEAKRKLDIVANIQFFYTSEISLKKFPKNTQIIFLYYITLDVIKMEYANFVWTVDAAPCVLSRD